MVGPEAPQPVERPRPWWGDELFLEAGWGQRVAETVLNVALADELRNRLEHGAGVCLLRGGEALVAGGEDRAARRFLQLAELMGTPVPQDPEANVLLHVRDEGYAPGDRRFRGPHSNRGLAFHSDRCDVIAFLCVRQAAEGGDNELISSARLHNDLLAEDAELCRALYEPLPYLRHTVDGGNPRPYTGVPLFSRREGHFAATYLRVLIDRADRSPSAPDLTPLQRRALDRLDELAEQPGRAARLRLAPGDVLLINNWVTLHRRAGFLDDPEAPRHLLRIWLAVPGSRPLDPALGEHFGSVEGGAVRGGFRVSRP